VLTYPGPDATVTSVRIDEWVSLEPGPLELARWRLARLFPTAARMVRTSYR
jgi:hypothetical protein